jgi:hypothetical protein
MLLDTEAVKRFAVEEKAFRTRHRNEKDRGPAELSKRFTGPQNKENHHG